MSKFVVTASLLAVLANASPQNRAPVIPKVRGTPKVLGLAQDVSLNRDSCGSSKFGHRTFWTCRDTQFQNTDGTVQMSPVITSTGSWSDVHPNGLPVLQALRPGADVIHNQILKQYGDNQEHNAYFPLLKDECDPPAGGCADGTRFALWPDLPPMVTESDLLGRTKAYTWIKKTHIRNDFSQVGPNPATTLYRVDYDPIIDGHGSKLPRVSVVNEEFWAEKDIPFGDYGNVVHNGIAYLYGQAANSTTALAKVSASQVENKAAYEYFVDGKWTKQKPKFDQTGLNIPNANIGGQGTYYYSEPWKSFVWIGGGNYPGASFFITTAPTPTGPWIEPFKFYDAPVGDYFLSAYSLQANPALTNQPMNNSIFLTYTKNDVDADKINVYTTPLVFVEWE